MNGPLHGIKILELARTLAGPYCSMILADLGAEVIKVEQPGSGDETRGFIPPTLGGESCYFMSLNRNKRSMTLNLKTEEGRKIVKELVAESDVLIENFRTGTMEKFGLGYSVLKEINPKLVYCGISGFGRTGPMKDDAAYDLLMQGFAGLMSVTGEPHRPPVKVGFSVADLATGMFAAIAILSALYQRELTGQGQAVEASLLESLVSLQTYLATGYFATGKVPKPLGSAHPNVAPYQVFEAQDGHFIIAVPNDGLWVKFCNALGLAELRDHPKFSTNSQRVLHREELVELLNAHAKKYKVEEIVGIIRKEGVPCGPINTIDKVLSHPQVLNRDMVVEVEHPTAGLIKLLGIPMKFSGTPGSVRLAPPLLGEHNLEILKELGYTEEDVARFAAKGVM